MFPDVSNTHYGVHLVVPGPIVVVACLTGNAVHARSLRAIDLTYVDIYHKRHSVFCAVISDSLVMAVRSIRINYVQHIRVPSEGCR